MTKARAASTADRIAATALEILEQEGPQAVSMRRVANAVGVTAMAIYNHFPNREQLLRTVVDREFSKLADDTSHLPRGGTHESRLLGCLDTYIRYALERPRIFDYVFSERRSGARRYPADFRAGRSPTLNQVAGIVSAAMDDGPLKKADKWEVALQLWAHVHGYLMLYRANRIDLSRAKFVHLVHRSTRRLLDGLSKQ